MKWFIIIITFISATLLHDAALKVKSQSGFWSGSFLLESLHGRGGTFEYFLGKNLHYCLSSDRLHNAVADLKKWHGVAKNQDLVQNAKLKLIVNMFLIL